MSESGQWAPEWSPWSLDRLAWPRIERHLARDSRLIFPVGALGQHGPHLPLGANALVADRVANAVSVELELLKAPPFVYGVLSRTKVPYPGPSGLRRKTLHRSVNELLAGWEDRGVSEIIMITAHRYDAHLDALLMALTTRAVTKVIDLYSVSLEDILEGSPVREHGGELETSLMLFLAPDRVCMDDVPAEPQAPGKYPGRGIPKPPTGSGGVVGYPGRASRQKGEAVFRRYVEMVVDAVTLESEADQGTTPVTGG